MNILQTIIARSLETSIRARVGLDSEAREALARLEGKKIQLNMSDISIGFTSVNGLPVVQEEALNSPDIEITGSITSVGQVLMSSDLSNAVVDGDESLLNDLNLVFHANMLPDELLEKGRAAASAGLAVARSAIEGIAGQLHNLRNNKAEKVDVQQRVAELEEELNQLKAKLEERDP